MERARPRGDFLTFLETREAERDSRTYTDANGREVRESLTQTYDHVAQTLQLTSYRRWREGTAERTKVTRETLRYTLKSARRCSTITASPSSGSTVTGTSNR